MNRKSKFVQALSRLVVTNSTAPQVIVLDAEEKQCFEDISQIKQRSSQTRERLEQLLEGRFASFFLSPFV